MKTTGICMLLIAVSFLAGCTKILAKPEPSRRHYYLNPHKDFSAVNRIALIELENHSNRSEMPEVLTQALANGFGRRHLFAVQTIHRSDPTWTTLDLDNIATCTVEDLELIRQVLNVDAVVFGTIKQYQPYPHFLMALHLRMVDTRKADLIWAMEQVWDSSDKQIEMRMKDYYSRTVRDGYQPLDWKILVTSPRAFNKFVVDEAAETLPELPNTAFQPSIPDSQEQFIDNKAAWENTAKMTKIF